MRFYALLIFFVLITSPVSAVIVNLEQVNSQVFEDLYRKFFEKEIVVELSASRAELNAVLDKRNQIIDYMNNNNLVISEEQITKAWQIYIKTNFKTIDEFAKYLENSFIKEFELKERFKQNLYFSKYFNEVISPQIKKDFEIRKKLFAIAETHKIDSTDLEFQETLYQVAENWGGMEYFNAYLNQNHISFMDISFYIKSTLLKNKVLDLFIKNKLQTDKERIASLESSALNEYNILNQRHKPIYFFKHAYIAKDVPNSAQKIEDYYKSSQIQEYQKLEKIEKSEIIVENFCFQLDPNSDLIEDSIKQIILKLSDDGLFVSKKISPIISKKDAYHIFQLNKIIIPENEDLGLIKAQKINNLRQEYKSNFNLVLEGL